MGKKTKSLLLQESAGHLCREVALYFCERWILFNNRLFCDNTLLIKIEGTTLLQKDVCVLHDRVFSNACLVNW